MNDNPTIQKVRVFFEDATGNRRREARVAAHVEIKNLIPSLISVLGLPVTDPSGLPITYYLIFADRQLQEDETLASAGVEDGATIIVVPEMIGGVRL